jgi:hypothetical protein
MADKGAAVTTGSRSNFTLIILVSRVFNLFGFVGRALFGPIQGSTVAETKIVGYFAVPLATFYSPWPTRVLAASRSGRFTSRFRKYDFRFAKTYIELVGTPNSIYWPAGSPRFTASH